MKNSMDLVSNDDLLARTVELVRRSRRLDAELIVHLGEVDARQLYRREACPSMFVYATARLGLSEAEAYLRITVARVARRLPIVLHRLAAGRIQLSAIVRLAPHLTEASAEGLLDRAEGRSKRQIEELAAELAPKPDAPAVVRRLPVARARADQLVPGRAAPPPVAPPPVKAGHPMPRPPSPVLVPLAPARYKIQFTASSEFEGKLARTRALLRHRIPDGDLAALFDLALSRLLADLERGKWAAARSPMRAAGVARPRRRSSFTTGFRSPSAAVTAWTTSASCARRTTDTRRSSTSAPTSCASESPNSAPAEPTDMAGGSEAE